MQSGLGTRATVKVSAFGAGSKATAARHDISWQPPGIIFGWTSIANRSKLFFDRPFLWGLVSDPLKTSSSQVLLQPPFRSPCADLEPCDVFEAILFRTSFTMTSSHDVFQVSHCDLLSQYASRPSHSISLRTFSTLSCKFMLHPPFVFVAASSHDLVSLLALLGMRVTRIATVARPIPASNVDLSLDSEARTSRDAAADACAPPNRSASTQYRHAPDPHNKKPPARHLEKDLKVACLALTSGHLPSVAPLSIFRVTLLTCGYPATGGFRPADQPHWSADKDSLSQQSDRQNRPFGHLCFLLFLSSCLSCFYTTRRSTRLHN